MTDDAPVHLTETEAERLLAQATGPKNGLRNRCMLELMYRRGLRVSEVVGINARDVKWDDQKIRLQETKAGSRRKGTRGTVDVFIPDRTWELLLQWRGQRKLYARGCERLFVTTAAREEGRPVTRQYVWGMVNRYARRAGLEQRVHPHTLRHSFATHLLQKGMNIDEVRRALRHRDIRTTQKYLHAEDPELRELLKDI